MNKTLSENIIDTLSYFDVFNYPLTLSELKLYLHYDNASEKEIAYEIKKKLSIKSQFGYFFFEGRENIALRRKMQESEGEMKRIRALNATRILQQIPGIKLVGVSGSAAMDGASKNDDIDLFIICRKNTLWIVRFITLTVFKVIGLKREKGERGVRDKFCFNMFVDEQDMNFEEDKSLYLAHEVIQMKTVYEDGVIRKQFLKENKWIGEYFPALFYSRKKCVYAKKWFEVLSFNETLVKVINCAFFLIQYAYMLRSKTTEKVGLTKAFFHPLNFEKHIMNEYKRRKRYYLSTGIIREDLSSSERNRPYYKKSKISN